MRSRARLATRLALPSFLAALASCTAGDEAPDAGSDAAPPPGDRPAATATAAPEAEIWLARLVYGEDGPSLAELRNATQRPGYDNQPHFLPDGTLLYTRQEEGQTDIWRYDPSEDTHSRVTTTEVESEYSATMIPGSQRFSVIQVEADGTQRLWSFPLEGGQAELVFPDLVPVGYHAWADAETAYLFILGSPETGTPATLHLARRGVPGSTELAREIGRSIRSIPGTSRVSYVQTTGEGDTEIRVVEPGTPGSELAAPGLDGGDYHAWLPDGRILQAQGNALYVYEPGMPGAGWQEVGRGPEGVILTRIAVSPDGTRLAVVAEPVEGG